MAFSVRFIKPETGNPYYNTVSNGGYSRCIVGKPTDPGCNVLSNCVGYALGRFNEIAEEAAGKKGWKYHISGNAEDFWRNRGNLTGGSTPAVGAIICWKKGAVGNSADGAGHVAIVEMVNSDGSILTSESGYNSAAFWTKTRYKGNGNWGATGYDFLGFIYNPAMGQSTGQTVTNAPPAQAAAPKGDVLCIGDKGDAVKELQQRLIKLGYDCGKAGVDGDFGGSTLAAVRKFQSDHKLTVDGVYGPATKTAMDAALSKAGAAAAGNVKVTASALNIRGGAGVSYPIAGVIRDRGVYEVTEVVNGFGKLADGRGWICLDFTEKEV